MSACFSDARRYSRVVFLKESTDVVNRIARSDVGQTVLGIDASNIREGGGVTHLTQLISAADPAKYQIFRVTIWGGKRLLSKLPERAWLQKVYVPSLDKSLPWRIFWQQLILPGVLRRAGCNVLFSPGGSVPTRMSIPSVTMSQNLLPFEKNERRRFGVISWMNVKLKLVGILQSKSFRRANGVIFLSRYAEKLINSIVKIRRTALIPHGVEARFSCAVREMQSPEYYSMGKPFRLLYVSIIAGYKHQLSVAKAVAVCRSKGLPIEIDFVGPAYKAAHSDLIEEIERLDKNRQFIHYRGAIAFEELHKAYAQADAFVFASSCENLPNILFEAMSAGLPILCSNRGPMPEVLGDAGLYFDPENVESITDAITKIFQEPVLREKFAAMGKQRVRNYSWERCADETFCFIEKVASGQ